MEFLFGKLKTRGALDGEKTNSLGLFEANKLAA
jgi:hypothetical protein